MSRLRAAWGRLRDGSFRHNVPRWLGAVGIASLLLWGFVRLGGEMLEGDTGAIDRWILLALRRPDDLSRPAGPHWLEGAMLDLTSLGSPAVLTLTGALAVAYLLAIRRFRLSGVLATALVLGTVAEQALKVGFARPRPDVVPHLAAVHSLSFPSGHAMLSAIVYLSLGALLAAAQPDRRAGAFVLGTSVLLTLIVGLSRVYLGVHWPSDVLAGWMAGALWAVLFWEIARAGSGPRTE